jgi:uncharacterized protein involved in exopolysaccharide biosynthesis
MARTVIDIGNTPVIKDLVAKYANHNARIIPLETLYAALLNRLEILEALVAAGGGTPTPSANVAAYWSTMQ